MASHFSSMNKQSSPSQRYQPPRLSPPRLGSIYLNVDVEVFDLSQKHRISVNSSASEFWESLDYLNNSKMGAAHRAGLGRRGHVDHN